MLKDFATTGLTSKLGLGIIGYIGVIISLIGTRPGKGIGKLIFEQIKENAENSGITKIRLDSVPDAFGFYSKLGLGIIGYIGVIISLIWSFKTGNVMAVNGLWDGMSTIIESLAAYLILGNRLENTQQYFGLGIIILGVFMLKYNPK